MKKFEELNLANFEVLEFDSLNSINGGAKTKEKEEKISGNLSSSGAGVDYEKIKKKD